MLNYSTDYVTKWKAGQSPKWDYPVSSQETLRAVLHDQTYMLYSIFKDDVAGFAEWVAREWQKDNDLIGDDESAEDYLDRIDVKIVSKPSRCKPRRIKVAKYSYESTSYNVILRIGGFKTDTDKQSAQNSSYVLLKRLDDTFIGTENYMGFAWFWGSGGAGLKYYLRDTTAKQKKIIHDSFMLNNIPLNKTSAARYGAGRTGEKAFFEDTEAAVNVVRKVLKVELDQIND
jgi:hypothetical protein